MPTYMCVLGDSDTYKIHTTQLRRLPIHLRICGVTALSIFFLQYLVPCGKKKKKSEALHK